MPKDSKIRLNPDSRHVAEIRNALRKNGGYCPCRFERTDDTECMCKEFRDQIADPNFYGQCHCGLYLKTRT